MKFNLENQKTAFKKFFNSVKDLDVQVIIENINNFKIQDLQKINLRRILKKTISSQYAKPVFGVSSASLLFIFLLVPQIIGISISQRKVQLYKKEASELNSKLKELKDESKKFELVKKKMTQINNSFLKKEQIILLTNLLNDAAKKSNVSINTFSPILKPDTAKLCKTSTIQKNSKKFKLRRRNKNIATKGVLQQKFYEVSFSSDYLDIIRFLNELQMYDINMIIYCLEVSSDFEISVKSSEEVSKKTSLITPLNQKGNPIFNKKDIKKSNEFMNLGKVSTRIVLKIPTFMK